MSQTDKDLFTDSKETKKQIRRRLAEEEKCKREQIEKAKQAKIQAIQAATSSAVLEKNLKNCEIPIKQKKFPSSTVLIIPIGEYGVEIDLRISEVMEWKETLPSLLSLISDGADIWKVLRFCYENRFIVLCNEADRYAAVTYGEECHHFYSNDSYTSLLSIVIPKSVEVIYVGSIIREFDFYPLMRKQTRNDKNTKILFEGTKKQWLAIEGKEWFTFNTSAETVKCSNGEVEIPTLVIKDNILTGCRESIFSAVIPNGVVEIDGMYSKSLVSLTMPISVNKINLSGFCCPSIKELKFDGSKSQWKSDFNLVFLKNTLVQKVKCLDGDFDLPSIIINNNTVEYCRESTQSVTIPANVTKIAYRVFWQHPKLKNLEIYANLIDIDARAFGQCLALEIVKLFDCVQIIGNNMFSNCEALSFVEIPMSLSKIGYGAFYGCKSLANIIFRGTKEHWSKIEKGDYWHFGISAKIVQCTDGDVVI